MSRHLTSTVEEFSSFQGSMNVEERDLQRYQSYSLTDPLPVIEMYTNIIYIS